MGLRTFSPLIYLSLNCVKAINNKHLQDESDIINEKMRSILKYGRSGMQRAKELMLRAQRIFGQLLIHR
jgi:hypothetical protein